MSRPNEIRLSKETEEIWNKVILFKQRYKEYSKKIESQREALAAANLELSLTKNECTRLKEELKVKQTSITKYQEILKELVEVEDRYCNLLQEKKNTEKELAAEKKLRLDLEKRHEIEKKEIRNSLEEELQTLKADAEIKEDVTIIEYSQTVEAKNKEIVTLEQKLSECVKKYEERLFNLEQDLKTAQNEIDSLRAGGTSKKVSNIGEVAPEINNIAEEERSFRKHSEFKNKKVELNCPTGNQEERNLPNSLPPTQQSLSLKKVHPLEVFRVPTSSKRSPVRKKRKLYSRSDDTL